MSDESETPAENPIDLIAASDFFNRLDRAALADISDELEVVTLPQGKTLFHQGDPGDSMYIVERGMLEVRLQDPQGQTRILDRIPPGSSVGEMALLTGQSRTADVVAVVDCKLVRLSQVGFERLARRHEALVSGFAMAVAPRIRRTQLTGILTRLFGGMSEAALQELERRLVWRRLADGEMLFHRGDPGDSMFIVVTGRLQIVNELVEDSAEQSDVLGEIGAGETVGEFALLTGELRSAGIIAVRDTDLVEMTRPVFEYMLREYPGSIVEISRLVVRRQQRRLRVVSDAPASALTLAVIPAGLPEVSLPDFAHRLAGFLSAYGPTAVFNGDALDEAYGRPGTAQIDPDDALSIVLNAWLQQQEALYRHILYVADPEWNNWTRRCLAQADRIVMVGRAGADPQKSRAEENLNPRARNELVLLHPDDADSPRGTAAWLETRSLTAHHHVREGDRSHWERLARRLTDRAVGFVLSGGAARGMAHIGVIHALLEVGPPVDYIGGASMGALIGGVWARGATYEEGLEMAKRFADPAAVQDRTFPISALLASRKVTEICRALLGDGNIEDLWRPFFCVSTNLSQAELVILERGPLWRAVRAGLALPGIFTPVLNERNEVLVDGGVMNNFPVDVMSTRCEMGLIIGSNVSPSKEKPLPYTFGDSIDGWKVLWSRINPFASPIPAPTLSGTLLRTIEVNSAAHRARMTELADLMIQPDVRDFSLLQFDAYEALIERGYRAALPVLTEWKQGRSTE